MDDATIEKVGEKVARVELGDHILSWDRKQAAEVWNEEKHTMVPNTAARRCQADKKHGILQMHGQGNALVCCVARPQPCTYSEPVSR